MGRTRIRDVRTTDGRTDYMPLYAPSNFLGEHNMNFRQLDHHDKAHVALSNVTLKLSFLNIFFKLNNWRFLSELGIKNTLSLGKWTNFGPKIS